MSPVAISPEEYLRRAIYGKLASDNTLTAMLGDPPVDWSGAQSIYHDQAPQNAGYPYIIFSKSTDDTPGDLGGFGGKGQTDIWLIKAVDHSTLAGTAEAIADRIRTQIDGKPFGAATLSPSAGTCLALYRQAGVGYPELVDGETYYHRGAQYRLVWERVT